MFQEKYGQLCSHIYESDHGIKAVAIILNQKQIVYKTSDSFPIPEEKDRLLHMMKQAYILINEPSINEDYFGKVKYVMVHHESYDMFLFRLDSDPLNILAIAATSEKYDHRELVRRVSSELVAKEDEIDVRN
jgi:hypothetical protein